MSSVKRTFFDDTVIFYRLIFFLEAPKPFHMTQAYVTQRQLSPDLRDFFVRAARVLQDGIFQVLPLLFQFGEVSTQLIPKCTTLLTN